VLRTDRTDEVEFPADGEPPVPSHTDDDQDAYYLADVSGNHVGILVPGESSEDPWVAGLQLFDAFGNRIDPHEINNPQGGAYAWRGAEGSETDRGHTGEPGAENASDFDPTSDEGTGLVYMQARYYDPEVGRFTQADRLPMASQTSQGLNRYLYCENDAINSTDASGTVPVGWVLTILGMLAAFGWAVLPGIWGQIFGVLSCGLNLLGILKISADARAALALILRAAATAIVGVLVALFLLVMAATIIVGLVMAAAFLLYAIRLELEIAETERAFSPYGPVSTRTVPQRREGLCRAEQWPCAWLAPWRASVC